MAFGSGATAIKLRPMSDKHCIAIVEDDPEIGPLVSAMLQKEGFETELATNGEALDGILARRKIDLIILDIMLPGEDGLTICRRLRAHRNEPILMLTAKTDEIDRIVGLEIGADDYLGKPFHPRELLARVRAILRRSGTDGPTQAGRMAFGDFVVDLHQHSVRRGTQDVELTSGEFALLRAFLSSPGRVLSRDQLMSASQNRVTEAFDRTVDVQISRLRTKLDEDPKSPKLIKTVRNFGYIFTAQVHHL
ncbi:MAG: response regulator [Pseudomonadota bacterium]